MWWQRSDSEVVQCGHRAAAGTAFNSSIYRSKPPSIPPVRRPPEGKAYQTMCTSRPLAITQHCGNGRGECDLVQGKPTADSAASIYPPACLLRAEIIMLVLAGKTNGSQTARPSPSRTPMQRESECAAGPTYTRTHPEPVGRTKLHEPAGGAGPLHRPPTCVVREWTSRCAASAPAACCQEIQRAGCP